MNNIVAPENPSTSEIWTAKIFYKGTAGNGKPRPVLIINFQEDTGLYTIQEITKEEPPEQRLTYFELCKELIKKWEEAGLKHKSYVKCSPTNTHRVERFRLDKYVGITDEDDFENIIEKIHEAKEKYNR